MLYAKTLQVLRLEMLQQAILGGRGRKDPVIQLKDKETRTESLLETLLVSPFDQHFLRGKIIE